MRQETEKDRNMSYEILKELIKFYYLKTIEKNMLRVQSKTVL